MKKKGKYAARRNMKPVVLMIAVVMLLGCAIGGTLAWLTDTTQSVVNTFTTSDIEITLTETDTDLNTDGEQHDYKMIPGWTIEKDPKATVLANSEDCWLFVEVSESASLDTYIDYAVRTGWTAGEGTGDGKDGIPTNVYYRQVVADDENQDFYILDCKGSHQDCNGCVLVNVTVTKTNMEALAADDAVQPTLTFTAYATQLYKTNPTAENSQFTAAEAWDIVKPSGT